MTEETRDRSGSSEHAKSVPSELAILPGQGTIIFPFMILPLGIQDPVLVSLIDAVVAGDRLLAVAPVEAEAEESPIAAGQIATASIVARMVKVPDGSVQVLLQGLYRVRIEEIVQSTPFLRARVSLVQDETDDSTEVEALQRNVLGLFQKVVTLAPQLPDELAIAAVNVGDAGKLADLVAVNLNMSLAEKRDVLETINVGDRLRRVLEDLNRELEILELGNKIQTQMKDQMDKQQREFYLREQLRTIQKELGEVDEKQAEVDELREKLQAAGLSEEANKEAERELARLARISPASPEYGVSRTYLEWLASLPWQSSTTDNLDLEQAQRVLDEDHYDLEKIKDRIIEYLAVRKLRNDARGPILCFVGPPGVGKTSLGQSIARALGRKFVRMSLGAVRDEAEIRGHRRTYVGALPGRILQGIRRAESNNPVFMLDEVDKLGMDFRGDPSSALLEVLDPAQNSTFSDHYLEVSFDLSKVMFITTANMLDPIPGPLLDRMEVLELAGYTEDEKLHIAERFLVPRQMAENGVQQGTVEFTRDALKTIVRDYTREAGVRNLEREIGGVLRKLARKVASGQVAQMSVSPREVEELLGAKKFRMEAASERHEIGMATGLAVTPVGGEVLFVEASVVPGHGSLILTGKLGDVMQESARAAITYVRSRADALGLPQDFNERSDIHIHIPAGAVPKDGPSAGVSLCTAVVSALTKRQVRSDLAMTGEITLRGKVLPIGGVKDKVLAAHRAGIRTVVLPKDNEAQLVDIPAQVREEMKVVLVSSIDEVLEVALLPATHEVDSVPVSVLPKE